MKHPRSPSILPALLVLSTLALFFGATPASAVQERVVVTLVPSVPVVGDEVKLTFVVNAGSGCSLEHSPATLQVDGRTVTYESPMGKGPCRRYFGGVRVTVSLGGMTAGRHHVTGLPSGPFVFEVGPSKDLAVTPAQPGPKDSIVLTLTVEAGSGCKVVQVPRTIMVGTREVRYTVPAGEGQCDRYIGRRQVAVPLGRLPRGVHSITGLLPHPFHIVIR